MLTLVLTMWSMRTRRRPQKICCRDSRGSTGPSVVSAVCRAAVTVKGPLGASPSRLRRSKCLVGRLGGVRWLGRTGLVDAAVKCSVAQPTGKTGRSSSSLAFRNSSSRSRRTPRVRPGGGPPRPRARPGVRAADPGAPGAGAEAGPTVRRIPGPWARCGALAVPHGSGFLGRHSTRASCRPILPLRPFNFREGSPCPKVRRRRPRRSWRR